jgi:lipopolysaccharide/colanic/teichoic acid biosynthesis glycosyltransferase
MLTQDETDLCQDSQAEGKSRGASAPPDGGPRPRPTALPRRSWYLTRKRPLDVALALVLLVLAAPLILLAWLLVKLTSSGPGFYRQTRLGRGGRPFTLYKIRTMRHDCERVSGPCWSGPGDPRVLGVGWFLRRTHLDELPQLWNVLRGDMSLVGPRPERPEFLPQLEQAVPHYRDRLLVRPGVTGLAQVLAPPDTDLDSVRRKLAYDRDYLRRLGFWLDLRLLVATACYLVGLSPGRALRLCAPALLQRVGCVSCDLAPATGAVVPVALD